MNRARTSDSFSPWGRFAASLLVLWSLSSGCVIKRFPEAIRQTFRNGQAAEKSENYREAIIHYNRVLEGYPDLVDALLARGECHFQLAEREPASRDGRLRAALADFEKAASVSDREPESRIRARQRQVTCLIALDSDTEAQEVLLMLLDDPLDPATRADTHRLLGHLMLLDFHRRVEVDQVIPTEEIGLLTEVRTARQHFGEAIHLDSGSQRALLGKGICLLHEGLLEESEIYLRRAQLASSSKESDRPTPGMLYLLALVREKRLGPNVESNEGFVAALAADRDRNYDRIYVRLYRLLGENPSAVHITEQAQIYEELLHYQGDNPRVWEAADTYFSNALESLKENHHPRVLLGHAVASARRGEARTARESFSQWMQAEATPEVGLRFVELTFRAGPSFDRRQIRLLTQLEKARVYLTLFDDATVREQGVEQLRSITKAFRELDSRQAEEDSTFAEACQVLADELVLRAESADMQSEPYEKLLEEAELLSLTEKHLREGEAEWADFRLQRIEFMRSDDLDIALAVTEKDPRRDYLPAYTKIARAYPRLARQGPLPPDEEALLPRVRVALLAYAGDDDQVKRIQNEIQRREEEAKARARARAEKERTETRLPRCPDCGRTVKPTDRVCRCGRPLD